MFTQMVQVGVNNRRMKDATILAQTSWTSSKQNKKLADSEKIHMALQQPRTSLILMKTILNTKMISLGL